ncbi:MAG: mechanosensitive ion channel [Planctomycetes bacterium]|nr:mechanosensitive ion channel [Planctomycetota bacterium]
MIRLAVPGCVVLLLGLLTAQEPRPQEPSPDIEATPAAIAARLDQLERDTALAAESKAPLVEALRRALELARQAESASAETVRLQQDEQRAPAELATVRAELAETTARAELRPGLPVAELEIEWQRNQQRLAAANQDATRLAEEVARRADRRTTIPTRLAAAQQALAALPVNFTDAATDPRLLAARRTVWLAQRRQATAEIELAQAEQTNYDATEELLAALRDRAARRIGIASEEGQALQAALQQARTLAAEQARAAAEQQAARNVAGPVATLAEENAALATELPKLAADRKTAEDRRDTAQSELQQLRQDFADLRTRVQAIGPTDAIGALLRQRRAALDDSQRLRQRRQADGPQLDRVQLRAFEIADLRRTIHANPERWIDQRLEQAPFVPDDDAELPRLRAEIRGLVDARLQTLQELGNGLGRLVDTLVDIDTARTQIEALALEYRSFVNEHVLWIRSSPPVWAFDFAATGAALRWLGDPHGWAMTAAAATDGLLAAPWSLVLVVSALLMLATAPFLHRRLRTHAATVRGGGTTFLPTTLALIDTLLLAAPWPLLMWLLGWRIGVTADCPDFGKAVAVGLQHAAWFLWIVLLLRALVRPDGLAETHFGWPPAALRALRANLPLLLLPAFPLAALLGALEHRGDDDWLGGLGRLLLIPMLLLMLVAFWRVLQPRTGLPADPALRDSLLGRLPRTWFLLGVGTPAVFLGMALLGYEYTALQLARRLQHTVALVLAGVVVYELAARALLLVRIRLQRQRFAQALAGASPDAATATDAGADPTTLTLQTQTLLRLTVLVAVVAAAFSIWVDVLPALGALRRIELWHDDASTPPRIVSLADLLLAAGVLAMAGVAARNLPALVELLLLRRLQMAAGERHAITTLLRYLLVIAGITLAFSAVGIGWSKVQWLVAAISVGLGFGLQEIFANFVSGLILLFERPARVGDIVAVGDVVGRVTRIRIRATTIQDWDRKELVVPNKEFITGRFVNWTLSDPVVRSTLQIGIAYGADVDLALRLLEQAARECPFVLAEPPPNAVFAAFGDSSLTLRLRVHEDDFDEHSDMLTDVNRRILRLFGEHGIAIPFPQLDVHLQPAGPVPELLPRAEARYQTEAPGPAPKTALPHHRG